jgi:hypothetical protein
LIEQAGAFKVQHTAWAAGYALATCQAMAVMDRYASPGMSAHVNADGTVVRANAALNTPYRFWHYVTLGQHKSIF